MSIDVRKLAKELHAADASELVKASVPFVLPRMTAAQLQQVQNVLDAAVVNPVLKAKADKLYREANNSNVTLIDQADEIMGSMISVTERDYSVRLDYEKLLTADALKPTTDNPDEAKFLQKVKTTLASKGVWFTFERTSDATHFQGWLTLGNWGDSFQTATGELNRAALLSNNVLGAGYYTEVHNGRVQTVLAKAIQRITNQIRDGQIEHSLLAQERDVAFPGVVGISDLLGGADYPDYAMWDVPSNRLLSALTLNVNGNVRTPSKTIVIAGLETAICAQRLAQYIDDTRKGAGRAVKVLHVLDVCGKVAGVIVCVYAVFATVTRLLAAEAVSAGTRAGAGAGLSKVPPPYRGPEALYSTNYAGREAFAKTLQGAEVGIDTGEGANAVRRAAKDMVTGGGPEAAGDVVPEALKQGMMDAYKLSSEAKVNELMQAFDRLGADASLDEKMQVFDAWQAKYGPPMEYGLDIPEGIHFDDP